MTASEKDYTDLSALWDYRNCWDERARQAEVYLSFRLEGKDRAEANALANEHFRCGNL